MEEMQRARSGARGWRFRALSGSRFFCVHGGFRTQAQLIKSLAICDCPPGGQGSETENSNPLNFPGGPVVTNPHFQCRVHGFSPRPGKFCGAAKK